MLAPNFRGSGSYSEERVRANVGDLGGGDADDVIACLDALAEHPNVDVSRIVLFGWSYGAHLAFHIARKLGIRQRTNARLAGAESILRIVAGGGVYDWLSHYGQAELRFPWREYLGASPLLDSREADARSPIRHARELGSLLSRCEVVLCAGQNDGRASPMQSRMMHRALGEAGWVVEGGGGRGYRQFRVLQTWPNARGYHYMSYSCAGIEMCGRLWRVGPAP